MYTNHRSGRWFKLHYITIHRFTFHAYPFFAWQKNTFASFIIGKVLTGKWGTLGHFLFLIRCIFPWCRLLREVDKVPYNLSLMPFLGQQLTFNQKKYKESSVPRCLQAKGDRSGNLRHQQRDSGPSEPWCPFVDRGTVGVRFAVWRYDQGTDSCEKEFLDCENL